MKKIDYEQISSLMDNEDKDLEQTLDIFLQDEEAARIWYEYHLIRDCLRHQESKLGFDISADIQAKIRLEPQYRLQKKVFRVANMPIKAIASIASVACVVVIAGVAWNIQSEPRIATQAMIAIEEPELLTNHFDKVVADNQLETTEIFTVPSYSKYEYLQTHSNFEDPYLRAHFEAVNHNGLMRVVGEK